MTDEETGFLDLTKIRLTTIPDAELLLWPRAAPRPLGSLFGSFSPRGARSKGDQQPDGRVAHNQKP